MKIAFSHGAVAGIIAGIAGAAYNYAYSAAMWVDFSAVINAGSIFGACLFGTILTSLGYLLFSKVPMKGKDPIFNSVLLLLSFATFAGTFGFQLPFDIESPEMFVGLSIPLHLFPALFWLATKPLFYK